MATIDHLMKQKTSSGYNVLLPITKPNNVKTVEPIEVMLPEGTTVGSYKNGETIEANTSVNQILTKMLQVQVPPTYTEPTIAIAATVSGVGTYEAGTTLTPTITSRFTQNDAGSITSHNIFKNNVQVATGTATPAVYSDTFTIADSTITYRSTCTYAAGAIKQDNFGADYPTGAIAAGSKTSTNLNFRSFRRYFYGVDDGAAPMSTSAEVRGLSNQSSAAAANGTTFNVSIPAGSRRMTIAYPATIRNISQAQYVESSNDDYLFKLGTPTTVSVEGANGFTAIDYKVYTWIPDQPWAAAMTLKITI